MQEAHSNKHSNDFDDEIDILELLKVLLRGKWIIISVTAFVSIIGVLYSLSLPNLYTSKALLVPVSPSSGFSGALKGYTGLAGLAGVNLSSSSDEGNSVKALEKISSLSFFENNILNNIFIPDLMALQSWNSQTNMLTYNESIYKIDSNTWVGDNSYPSIQKSFRAFNSHLNISVDKTSGFVSISVKHQSPFIAKQWAVLVVDEINAFYRHKDKLASEKAVSYLNQQISKTGLSEIKQVLAQLLQEEIKKLTLIEANEAFVFDYIDPPAVMEMKSEPSRASICILIALFGGMLSILLVFIRHYFFSEYNRKSSLDE